MEGSWVYASLTGIKKGQVEWHLVQVYQKCKYECAIKLYKLVIKTSCKQQTMAAMTGGWFDMYNKLCMYKSLNPVGGGRADLQPPFGYCYVI